MAKVPVAKKELNDACVIVAKAGTNGLRNGDRGKGGRTVFGLENVTPGDMRIRINGRALEALESVEILVAGDAEARVLVGALEFAANVIKSQQDGCCSLTVRNEEID
jgi:hypothetical protein